MKQTDINPDQIIKADLTGSAKALNPTVYKDNDMYFCLLGDDDLSGVAGSGKTVDHALIDWDKNLQARLKTGDSDDEVVKMVRGILSERKVKPLDMDEFNAQFRPLRKK